MTGNIFHRYLLTDFIESYRARLILQIDSLEITAETNINTLIEKLKAEYKIDPLILGEPIRFAPRENFKEVRGGRGGIYNQKFYEIDVNIPYSGNIELFQCHPSSSFVVYLDDNIRINSNNIRATITLHDLDPTVYDSLEQNIISDISLNLPKINEEIAPWNNGLENYIKELLEKRKGEVSKKHDFMEKIGLKVNPNSNEFMIPPQIAKKAIPVPVSETTKEVKKEYIPILQEEVYKDIITVLYNVGKAIERKPSIYINKHEEDLRDIFLLFLETRYDSTSGVGEAFNKKGKTDILLKYSKDGTNIFVAECKFWKGKKKLFEAIDQLLGYLTHRDSKTALILFVNQKDFTFIVDSVKDVISKHSQFKRHVRDTYEHSINFEFVLPDDSKKFIQIEVIFFHFPPIK
ncbi:MAG TPA: hypothetical protein PKA90_12210 [Ignavibacteria bacterium]|nr:hypothetical protein [Ignavibacteria bacterium]HMR41184.1 hypothetical protein [Ignavibacteria bacterium]